MKRKLFVFNMVSLDGYFEGPNHDLSWHTVDAQFNQFAVEMLQSIDAILFGRVTYELMASFWPTAKPEDPNDAIVKEKMNTLTKHVVSTTLKNVEEKENWKNVHLIKENVVEQVKQVKQQEGKNIALLGSGKLMQFLVNENLIDEYCLMVNPLILGSGTPLFSHIVDKHSLKLMRTRTFTNGNVLLVYKNCSANYKSTQGKN